MERSASSELDTASVTLRLSDATTRVRLILGLALALRLAVLSLVLSLHSPTWLFTRAPEMASLASSISRGQGLSSPFGGNTGPTAFLAPGYPTIIAVVFLIFGDKTAASAMAVLALQTVFSLLTVWATMLLAKKLFGERVAFVAGLMAAAGLPLLWIPAIFWETSLSTLLLTIVFALAVQCRRSPTARTWVALGISSGIAVLVNPALALVMIAILTWTAHKTRFVPSPLPLLAFAILFAMFLPWPIRNARALHHFIPLRSNFGFELWMGNHPGGNGDFDDSSFPIANLHEHSEYVTHGEVAYMAEKSALARSYILNHPATFALTTAKRVAWFWLGAGGKPNAWLGAVHATITSLFGFLGLILLFPRRKAIATLFVLPLVIFPLPYYITHADLRFRLVLDPLLIILTAYAIVRFGVIWKGSPNTHITNAMSRLSPHPAFPSLQHHRSIREVSGQSLIEIALFLPIFVTLICYAVDFGYYFLVAASLDSAARNAVEYSVQGATSTSQAAEPGAAIVSNLAISSIGLSNATASTVSVRLCSSSVGVNIVTNTTQCATPSVGAGAISAAADVDPESPTFLLNRVDVAYTVIPPVPMPASIFPTLTFHRMVEMRSIQ